MSGRSARTSVSPDPSGGPERRRRGHGARVAGLALSAAALVVGFCALGQAASAAWAPVPETGTPGRLELWSDSASGQFRDLQPGRVVYWQVLATVESSGRGGAASTRDAAGSGPVASLTVELLKRGALAEHSGGMTMTVDRCAVAWSGLPTRPRCGEGQMRIASATPKDDFSTTSPVFDLHGVDPGGTHVLVGLSLDPEHSGDRSLMGLTGEIGLGFTAAAGDPVIVEPIQPVRPTTPAVPADPRPPTGDGSPTPVGRPAGGGDPLAVTGMDAGGLAAIGLGTLAIGALGLRLVAVADRRDSRERASTANGGTR